MKAQISAACVAVSLSASATRADVVILNSYTDWSAALGGGDAKIDFIGQSGFLTDQYASLGAHFLPGSAFAAFTGVGDGWAAATTFPSGNKITLDFDSLQYGVGLNPNSLFKASLFLDGDLVFSSGQLSQSGGVFRGLLSSQPFNRVVFEAIPATAGSIDNIYIGNPIPAPGVGFILGCASVVLAERGRRRAGWSVEQR